MSCNAAMPHPLWLVVSVDYEGDLTPAAFLMGGAFDLAIFGKSLLHMSTFT